MYYLNYRGLAVDRKAGAAVRESRFLRGLCTGATWAFNLLCALLSATVFLFTRSALTPFALFSVRQPSAQIMSHQFPPHIVKQVDDRIHLFRSRSIHEKTHCTQLDALKALELDGLKEVKSSNYGRGAKPLSFLEGYYHFSKVRVKCAIQGGGDALRSSLG